MGKAKVLLVGNPPEQKIPEVKAVIEAYRAEFDMVFVTNSEETAVAELIGDVRAAVIPWSPRVLLGRNTLEQAKKLEIIVTTYGGMKKNVDTEKALEMGLKLSCTGPARARSVAEFTLGLTMASLLHIARIHHEMRSGESFPRHGYTSELTGRRIGIIGFGAVSRDMMKLLAPFNGEILVSSEHAELSVIEAVGGKKVALETLLSSSEIVMVLTGLTPRTEGMIDAKRLALMPDGALLINTARGKIINEKELIKELQSGRLNAALDVYEVEPLPKESPLRDLDNAVLAAHSANSTKEMDQGRWEFALEELRAHFSGKPLKGELDQIHLARMSDD